MADTINSLNFTLIVRSAPKNGPSSSDAWNDSFRELSTDLATIASEWNNKLVPIINGLPDGELDTNINVFTNGLDARSIWVNGSATSTDTDLTFYDTINSRPVTVEEALVDVRQYVDAQIDQTTNTIVDLTTGLTTDQKNRIGANVFDNSQVSASTSLDGKSEKNRLNIIQLAVDMYGSGYTLAGTGATQLTNSVFNMVDALLELHNGNWSDDVALNHSGSFSATQQDINTSAPGNDSYAGSPTHTEDDLNQIRTAIKGTKGTTGWLSSLSSLYASGANSLESLLTSTAGSATKSASNPWGYRYDDVDGLETRLDAIRDFTGQDSHTDSTPSYSGTNYISNGDDLELAVGKLDVQLNTTTSTVGSHTTQLAALLTFVGQNTVGDDSPGYSSTVYIDDGDSLETAIGKLDLQVDVNDANITTQSGYFTAIQTFTGQDSPTDTTPTYTSTAYVDNDDPLETAIGKLDAQVYSNANSDVTFSSQLSALLTFVGQDNITDSTPFYSSTTYISNGDPLETAIGTLDSSITTLGDHGTLTGLGDDDHPQYVRNDGDTMSGVLNMSWNTIDNVASPTSASQVATKGFVESKIVGLEWQDSVADKDLTVDPSGVDVGSRYIVAGSGGLWSSGTIDDIAEYTSSGWVFYTPGEGYALWVDDEDVFYVYNTTAWVKEGTILDHGNLQGKDDDDHTQYLLTDGTRAADSLDITNNLELSHTNTSASGVITKAGSRFIHDFSHPTGDTAIPIGQNAFIGFNAGNFTMGSTATETYHGSYNYGFGRFTLLNNATGYQNTAFGVNTLLTNISGFSNVANGANSLNANVDGYECTGVGSSSLQSNISGFKNSAIGSSSGRYLSDGSSPNQTSNTSLYLGSETKASADGNSNEIVIGYNTTGHGSNSVTLGNTDTTSTILRGAVDINSSVTASGNITSSTTIEGEHLHSTDDITASGFIRCETRIEAGQDIEVTNDSYGLILKSPNGTRYRVAVDNGGALTTTAI